MIIEKGEKVHIIMRRLFPDAVQRHFAGEVVEVDRAIVRICGYVFIYDPAKAQYIRKPELRTSVLDLAESGYIANIMPREVVIADLRYETVDRSYLVITDGKDYQLDIHEFGPRR